MYENKGRPRINFVVDKKKKGGLILFPLQIHKGSDLEIQSSVRMAADKQREGQRAAREEGKNTGCTVAAVGNRGSKSRREGTDGNLLHGSPLEKRIIS